MRENVTLQCGDCKRRNYATTKNKKKTTWPSRREVYGTTVVVIVTVVICAFYLWVVDMIIKAGMDRIFMLFQ